MNRQISAERNRTPNLTFLKEGTIMTRTFKLLTVAVLFGVLAMSVVGPQPGQAAAEITGRQVAENVDTAPTPDDGTNRMAMTLVNDQGKTLERTLQVWKQGREKSAMVFLGPDDVRGTGFLTIDREDQDTDDMWLYLPDLDMTKRIDSEQKHQSFMGSDFTYDDMGDREIDDYAWTLLGEETYDGHHVYVVEGQAKAPRDAGYSKLVSWVRDDVWKNVKTEYYDLNGELRKIQTNSNIEEIGGYWTITHLEMTNVQTDHETTLELTDIQVNPGLPDAVFTAEELPNLLERAED